MWMKRIAVLVACATTAIVLTAASAAADMPEGVTLTTTQVCPSLEATFVATGAIEDSGDATATMLSPQAGPFGVTGVTLRAEVLFEGQHGTFTLVQHVTFMSTDDPDVFGEPGTWVITGGTGDYAGLTGRGRSFGTCDLGAALEVQFYEGFVR